MSASREDHEDWCPARHLDTQPCACMRRQINAAPTARALGVSDDPSETTTGDPA